jgi:anthranilate synthase/phosphoribosyltransferase
MLLIIDNYDSFTYNLYQYLTQIYTAAVKVVRNDRIDIPEIERLHPEGILISPGPGRPEDAGVSVELVCKYAGKIPIMGVCLGHQAIGYAFGGAIIRAKRIVHGKTEPITHDGRGIFRNIPSPVRLTRYHSLALSRESLPPELEITATSADGEIMGVRHREYVVEGIQIHPESIASEYGMKILANFLNYRREPFQVSAVLTHILSGKNLTREQSASIMDEITGGELTDAQTSSFLTAMNTKTISGFELCGLASILNNKKTNINAPKPLLDTCGTGGDGLGTFNISSMAALIVAACGMRVAKHGNRSISSRSGSADFYEKLGIPIDLSPTAAEELLRETGFTFLFAPKYHPSMRYVAKVRRELGIKTVMNLLGPLANPADADYQLLGVYAENLCRPMAEASNMLGRKRVTVIHSLDGLDEISVCAPTKIVEIDSRGKLIETLFHPDRLGISGYTPNELAGGTPQENALIAMELIGSRERTALQDSVLVNAGAALYTCSMAENIREGYIRAKAALESGVVAQKLDHIKKVGNRLMGLQKEKALV